MSTYTQGPWAMRHGDGWTDIEGTDGHGRICRVYCRATKTNELAEKAGNLALIAAAPELLAALKAALACVCFGFDVQSIIANSPGSRRAQAILAARAAIAKAEKGE